MKFVNLDEIWKKFPNKYQALVMIAKEVRKINEAHKPYAPKPVEIIPETAVPVVEPPVVDAPGPKKRGRKPKKVVIEETKQTPKAEISVMRSAVERSETTQEMVVVETSGTGKRVVAEKSEENPYFAAIKKILSK